MNRRKRRVFVLLTMLMTSVGMLANEKNEAESATFNWNPVMEAIIQVESKGNPRAVSGNAGGAVQITPSMVAECNNSLEKRTSEQRFTLADRFNVAKSKEMFILFQSFHNPKNNVEQAIRSWNGGMRYTVRGTQRYFNKVMKYLKH